MNLKLLLKGAFLLLFLMLPGCVTGGGEGYFNYPYHRGYDYSGSYNHGYPYRDRDNDRGYDHPSYGRNGWYMY
jgi:hypothetical protein